MLFLESGLPNIKQIASLKKAQISSLETVIPFLEITANQQYLVKRIRGKKVFIVILNKLLFYYSIDLAKGGCVGKFNWNSGGSYNLKPWNEELPTDSAVIYLSF